jgi:hypothetical protein
VDEQDDAAVEEGIEDLRHGDEQQWCLQLRLDLRHRERSYYRVIEAAALPDSLE